MEYEESSKILPDELVERIIAFMPYPSIFKARGLSKSWLVRFSPIGSLADKVEKRLATSFQQKVRERSNNWGPFFPISLSRDFSSAYDWASQNWVPLPSMCALSDMKLLIEPNLCINGALACRLNWPHPRTLSVGNIFTRKWKMLPARWPFLMDGNFSSITLVSDTSLETYKLILFYEVSESLEELAHWSAHIYDSKLNAWSREQLIKDVPILGNPAYLNGLLYMVTSFDLRNLVRVNLEEGTSEEVKLEFHEVTAIENVDLIVCNGKLLMCGDDVDSPETLCVLQVDLESSQLFEVTRCPPSCSQACSSNTRQPVSHGGCIFFGMHKSDNPKLVYNMHKNEWSCFHLSYPWRRSIALDRYSAVSFQPGLNPFMDV